MERSHNKIITSIIYFNYLYFLMGVVWHLFDVTRPFVLLLTPYTLFIISLVIFYFSFPKLDLTLILWLVGTFVLTMIIEILGVNTGIIFGNYYYGNILGLKFFEVPIIIGINWTIVIYGLYSLVDKFIPLNNLMKSSVVGFMAVLFDIILEPAAIKLNYWHWESQSVPIENYISWFFISFSLSFIGGKLLIKVNNTMVIHYFFAQFLFFFLLLLLI